MATLGEFNVTSLASIKMLAQKLRFMLGDGGNLHIIVTDGRKRSLNQNALFHKWCGEISEFFLSVGKEHLECGAPVTPETIKAKLKARYLPTEYEITWSYAKNKVVKRPKPVGTSKLPKGQMYAFMECVHNWCIDYSIPVTIPEQSEYHQIRVKQGLAA